jgi:tetratricopeptide (TPR) repeat protein
VPYGSEPQFKVQWPLQIQGPFWPGTGLFTRFSWPGLKPSSVLLILICIPLLLGTGLLRGAQETNSPAALQTQRAFDQAKQEHQLHPDDPVAAWHFARACFDLADDATKSSDRAEIAQQGIGVCTEALVKAPDSAPLHYYLGLNQGQLARTRSLGALKLVDQMEIEFTRAIALDASFDYAGPDRTLGVLYRDAPAWASIGNRTKARQHLQRALELAPDYPENRLALIESELKWGDRKAARQDLKLLQGGWSGVRSKYNGPSWTSNWTDWEARLEKIQKTLDETPRLESPRH